MVIKVAKVIALFKKSDKYQPNNYRPISLLSCFNKIFEKLLCEWLVKFLEANKILFEYQYGFCMMTSSNGNISALLALCAGNSPVPVNSPHKGQWRGALMFPLICVWINNWVNNREAGDLRRHRGHYDVSVMVNFIQPL